MTDRKRESSGRLAWPGWTESAEQHFGAEGDDQETRLRKAQFATAAIAFVPAGLFWGAVYFAYGEHVTAAIPFAYVPLLGVNLLVFLRLRSFELFRNCQQAVILVLPFALQLSLGGFVGGSAAIVWSFIAVLMAVLFGPPRAAVWWFVAYVAEVVAAAALQPSLEVTNSLPHWLVTSLFALNIATVSLTLFLVLTSFVTYRRKLRALEVAYLNQELALRQSEKMATLGTLSAGIAHELNNPAAATRRAAEQLRQAIERFEAAHVGVDVTPLTPEGRRLLQDLEGLMRARSAGADDFDALERSDREAAVGEWLETRGVRDAWEVAPSLADEGLDVPTLSRLAETVDGEVLATVLVRASAAFPVYRLLYEIGEGSRRVSEIVTALRSYSFLGQAPVQAVDLREGLDNTLVILRSKLKEGIDVHRDYSADLPPVRAYGSELNQVWTNLLDNAIYALGGTGTITIRTRRDGDWAIIEVEDDGPGIPESVKARIFDPFFTTKEPGKGTGLGLSTSFSIVTEKHHGKMTVESQPGRTTFTVCLPLETAPNQEPAPA